MQLWLLSAASGSPGQRGVPTGADEYQTDLRRTERTVQE